MPTRWVMTLYGSSALYTNEELGMEIDDIMATDGKETCGTGKRNAENEEDRRSLNELNVQPTE